MCRRHLDDRDNASCKLCGIPRSVSDVTRFGPHHRILQGTDQPMCCERAEGAHFRREKPGCPTRSAVLGGFVYSICPETPLEFADRGPDHTVGHQPSYHDVWFDLNPDGMVSRDLVCQEHQKGGVLFRSEVEAINARVTVWHKCRALAAISNCSLCLQEMSPLAVMFVSRDRGEEVTKSHLARGYSVNLFWKRSIIQKVGEATIDNSGSSPD